MKSIASFLLSDGVQKRLEDIQNSHLYKELVEDCGSSECIELIVKSYFYGEGNPEPADMENLKWLGAYRVHIMVGKSMPNLVSTCFRPGNYIRFSNLDSESVDIMNLTIISFLNVAMDILQT